MLKSNSSDVQICMNKVRTSAFHQFWTRDHNPRTPLNITHDKTYQCQIQDFREGAPTTWGGGVPTYYLTNFSRKLHENEEILVPGGGGARLSCLPLDLPLPMV